MGGQAGHPAHDRRRRGRIRRHWARSAAASSRSMLKVMGTSTCDVLLAPRTGSRRRWSPASAGRSTAPCFRADWLRGGAVRVRRRLRVVQEAALLAARLDARGARARGSAARERLIAAWITMDHPRARRAALAIPACESAVLALDWMNGRRTPDANQRLKGAITGISLGTDAPWIYRALVEATAFGSRAIVERFRSSGSRSRARSPSAASPTRARSSCRRWPRDEHGYRGLGRGPGRRPGRGDVCRGRGRPLPDRVATRSARCRRGSNASTAPIRSGARSTRFITNISRWARSSARELTPLSAAESEVFK